MEEKKTKIIHLGAHGAGKTAAAILATRRSKSIFTVPSSQIEQMPGISAEGWIKDEAQNLDASLIKINELRTNGTIQIDAKTADQLNRIADESIRRQAAEESAFIRSIIEMHTGEEFTLQLAERITRIIDATYFQGGIESYWLDIEDSFRRKKLFTIKRETKHNEDYPKFGFSTTLKIIYSCLDSDKH